MFTLTVSDFAFDFSYSMFLPSTPPASQFAIVKRVRSVMVVALMLWTVFSPFRSDVFFLDVIDRWQYTGKQFQSA